MSDVCYSESLFVYYDMMDGNEVRLFWFSFHLVFNEIIFLFFMKYINFNIIKIKI